MKIHSKKIKLLIIELLFILVAISFVLYPLMIHHGFPCDDTTFSMQRLSEIFKDVLHGQYPGYDYYSSYPLGADIATMYPWAIMALFAPLSLFLKPLELWFTMIALGMFMGLNISFWCFKKSTHMRDLASLFFALAFCVSDEIMGWIYLNADIGAYFAIMFSPIAFFGWIQFYRNNKWKMMTIGLILMFACHIMSGIVMVLVLLVATACLRNAFNKQSIINGFKSFITLLLTTTIIWLPAFIIGGTNKVNVPSLTYLNSNNEILVSASRFFSTYNMRGWSAIDLLGLLIVIYCLKDFKGSARVMILIALGCLCLNFSTIWSFLVNNTLFKWFQFAFRFDFITDLIITWLLSIALFGILPKKCKKQTVQQWILLLVVIIFAGEGLSNYHIFTKNVYSKQQSYFTYGKEHMGNKVFTPNITDYNWKHDKYLSRQKVGNDYIPISYDKFNTTWYVRNAIPSNLIYKLYNIKAISPANIKYITTFSNNVQNRHPFYKESLEKFHRHSPLLKRHVTLGFSYHKRLPMKQYPKGVQFNSKDTTKAILPITIYNHQDYQFKLNHKACHPTIKSHHVIELRHLKKHHNYTFTFKAPFMWFNYVAFVLTIIGIGLLIML